VTQRQSSYPIGGRVSPPQWGIETMKSIVWTVVVAVACFFAGGTVGSKMKANEIANAQQVVDVGPWLLSGERQAYLIHGENSSFWAVGSPEAIFGMVDDANMHHGLQLQMND
jgi:hypothetical protein